MQATSHESKTTKNMKLHVAIAASGKSQNEIANAVGISYSVLSDIKAGRRTANAARKRLIAEALGTTVEKLFEDSNKGSQQ